MEPYQRTIIGVLVGCLFLLFLATTTHAQASSDHVRVLRIGIIDGSNWVLTPSVTDINKGKLQGKHYKGVYPTLKNITDALAENGSVIITIYNETTNLSHVVTIINVTLTGNEITTPGGNFTWYNVTIWDPTYNTTETTVFQKNENSTLLWIYGDWEWIVDMVAFFEVSVPAPPPVRHATTSVVTNPILVTRKGG
ncbi:MAG: hypothetical protein KKA90_01165 [Nanoarchaeota archaeon]|nr:hypothetical protein [Nanoarchaeota archaeon]